MHTFVGAGDAQCLPAMRQNAPTIKTMHHAGASARQAVVMDLTLALHSGFSDPLASFLL